MACHTHPGGKEFAGGRAMPTPFGALYVPNITPDEETGIGAWTADDFYRMMHTGGPADGTLLYPAMPFASYTKVTRADSRRHLRVPDVGAAGEARRTGRTSCAFPSTSANCSIGWRTLYFTQGEFKPDPKQNANSGTAAPTSSQGLGHCAMCHTAVNALGGSQRVGRPSKAG